MYSEAFKMLYNKLMIFAVVFVSHLYYINGHLILQENDISENMNSKQDFSAANFKDEGIQHYLSSGLKNQEVATLHLPPSVDPCSSNPCKNDGLCERGWHKGSFFCRCVGPWDGKTCEEGEDCDRETCHDRGYCIGGPERKGWLCKCNLPFSGPSCEDDLCTSNPCNNGGKCELHGRGYKCTCIGPWKGKACEIGPCNEELCQNNGICKSVFGGEICTCRPPYSGPRCKDSPCTSNPCKNNGTCKVAGKDFRCTCTEPWKGKTCEEGPCSRELCQNGGTCIGGEEDDICICKQPFSGPSCLNDPCSSNPCQNGGTCRVYGSGHRCNCTGLFKGKNCEISPCSAKPCQNGGVCKVEGSSFKCQCKIPYSGETCETSPCSLNPCLKNGNCTVVGNGFKCSCYDPYFGETCEKDPCSLSPCRNGGTCKIEGNSFTCSCYDNFIGDTCELECNCKNGKCRLTFDDKVLCECPSEYGKRWSHVCEACDCGTSANCTWEDDSHHFGESKYCLCPDGSKLKEQRCEDPCSSNPCVNSGTCKVEGKIFKCECKPPYFGPTCNKDPCTNNPCANGGTCRLQDDSFKCDCKEPYFGHYCKEDPCSHNPCNFGGTCRLFGNSTKCECMEPFFGDYCEKNPCSSDETNPCKNGGYCKLSDFDETIECICKWPYFGDKCENGMCITNPCQNGGTCKEDNGTAKCTCPPPYIGEHCTANLWCTEGEGKDLCKGGGCTFDFKNNLGRCTCPEDHYYDYEKKQCEVVDQCLFLPMKCNEAYNEVCKYGACQCKDGFLRNEATNKCEPKSVCPEGGGKEACKKRNAICVEDFDHQNGFKCLCERGFGEDTSGTCKRKCALPSQKELCNRKGAICDMDGSEAICRCPPLLTIGPDGRCSDFVNASYIGELLLSLQRYSSKKLLTPSTQAVAEDYLINIDSIRQDLRESMHALYGEKYHLADVLNCNIQNITLKCLVELQFKSDPQNQVQLIVDSNSCLPIDEITCFIPPKLFLDKKSQETSTFTETNPCLYNITKDICGRDTKCKRKKGFNFECACQEGLQSYDIHKPLNDPSTVIQKCEDIDECKQKTACPNTTSCFNTYKSYECFCLKGFKPQMENSDLKKSGCVDVCYPDPCKHGKCEIMGDVYGCKCDVGYTGSDCNEVILNSAGEEGLKTAQIILSVIVVSLILLSGFVTYKYRILKKERSNSPILRTQVNN